MRNGLAVGIAMEFQQGMTKSASMRLHALLASEWESRFGAGYPEDNALAFLAGDGQTGLLCWLARMRTRIIQTGQSSPRFSSASRLSDKRRSQKDDHQGTLTTRNDSSRPTAVGEFSGLRAGTRFSMAATSRSTSDIGKKGQHKRRWLEWMSTDRLSSQ